MEQCSTLMIKKKEKKRKFMTLFSNNMAHMGGTFCFDRIFTKLPLRKYPVTKKKQKKPCYKVLENSTFQQRCKIINDCEKCECDTRRLT